MAFCFSLLISPAYSRGPHHPRGAKIVKRHVHTRPSKDIKLTEDIELLHDREHIQVTHALKFFTFFAILCGWEADTQMK